MDTHARRTLEHYGLAVGDPAAEVLSHYGIGPRTRPATASEKALAHYGIAPSRTAGGWIDKAVAELAHEEGLDLEDMDIRNKEGRGYRVESDGGRGDSGESEWVVFKNDRDAEEYAVEYVEEMIDQDPGSFNPESLARFITIPDASTIAKMDADNYWNDMRDDEVLERTDNDDAWQELDEEWDTAEERIDEIQEEIEEEEHGSAGESVLEDEEKHLQDRQKQIDKEKAQLVDTAREEGAEEHAEDMERRINDDPVEWLSEMGYDDMGKILDLNFVRVDTARAAQSFVDDDGVAHYLDRVDSYETDLNSGAVAYGVN
jgi:hypothetical protein